MALQKQVNQAQALGFGGQVAKGRDSYFQTTSGVAVDDKVVIGSFVQTTDKEGEYKGVGQAIVSGQKIAGLAIFDNFRDGSADSASVAKGDTFTILQVGSAFIETSEQTKAGQKVVINTAGAVKFVDSITSEKDTGFIVEKGNANAKAGVVLITTARAYI